MNQNPEDNNDSSTNQQHPPQTVGISDDNANRDLVHGRQTKTHTRKPYERPPKASSSTGEGKGKSTRNSGSRRLQETTGTTRPSIPAAGNAQDPTASSSKVQLPSRE